MLTIIKNGAVTVNGAFLLTDRMGARLLVTFFLLLALVARVAAPCPAEASTPVDATATVIAKCHLQLKASPAAADENDQAPFGGLDQDDCSCALCHIGWTTLSPTDAIFAIQGFESHRAPRAPPAQTPVAFRPNRSAPTRGPPSHA